MFGRNNLARLYGEIYLMEYVWGEYSMLDDIIGNGMQDCIDGIIGLG
jgi:hypothetical protein